VKHIRSVNDKARRIEAYVAQLANEEHAASSGDSGAAAGDDDVVALQQSQPPNGPHIPLGCTFLFSPGWETDSRGGTAGLCQPVERDLFDCHLGCFWPAHVPDQLNHAPDWTGRCAAAQKDWRKIDLIFP
jgi:hypothetical protein